jgi:hypothetical protein
MCDIFVVVLHTKFKVLDSRPNSVYRWLSRTLNLVGKAITNISHNNVQKLYTELGRLSRTLNLVC